MADQQHPITRARAALADEPAVPQGRYTRLPSDEELRDLWSWAAGQDQGPWPTQQHCFARAVLARWGNPAPTPPADGEVAELVAEIRHFLAGYQQMRGLDPEHIYSIHRGDKMEAHITVSRLTRAAELLLQRQVTVPVAVSERMPEPSTKVLAHYVNDLGKGRTICAIWVPAKSRSNAGGDDDFTEYDEEDDKFYWPEGWYEAIENWDELGWVKVYKGEVVYWQPLPKWPARAAELLQRQVPVPVSVADRPWEREGWCDADGNCWLGGNALDGCTPTWIYGPFAWAERFQNVHRILLPAHALPLPEVGE